MATTKEYYEYVMECLNKAGEVTSRKMMGEYCLYFDGKLFGVSSVENLPLVDRR